LSDRRGNNGGEEKGISEPKREEVMGEWRREGFSKSREVTGEWKEECQSHRGRK
jgi:hypothetical protein